MTSMSLKEFPSTRSPRDRTRASRVARVIAASLATVVVLGSCADDPVGPSLGSLIVTINGLPDGTDAAVTVSPRQATGGAPPTNIYELTRTDTLDALVPGVYGIVAEVVEIDGARWVPVPATREIDIPASNQPATATITYVLGATELVVTIAGLPTGLNAAVSVSGPGGYSRTLTAGELLTGLAAGTYTIAAAPVTTDNGTAWRSPVPTTQTITLVAGGS